VAADVDTAQEGDENGHWLRGILPQVTRGRP
jgi:hypothetical protein